MCGHHQPPPTPSFTAGVGMFFDPSQPDFQPLQQQLQLKLSTGTICSLPPLPDPRLLHEEGGIPFPRRLRTCQDAWKELLRATSTSQKMAKFILEGIQNGFNLKVDKQTPPFALENHRSALEHEKEVSEQLDRYLQLGILVPTTEEEAKGINPLAWMNNRLVMDGSFLSDKMPEPAKFTYEDWSHAAQYLQKDWYMTKADARLLYLCIPLDPETSSWCAVQWNGRLLRFEGLPLGVAPAPLLATTVVRPVVGLLRQLHINLSQYLDDGFVAAKSREQTAADMQNYLQVFTRLGFLMHPRKCIIEPTQEMEWLGFKVQTNKVDTKYAVLTMTTKKRRTLVEAAKQVMKAQTLPARKLARWIGSVVAAHRAFQPALFLLTHSMEALAAATPQRHSWRTAEVMVTQQIREEARAVRRAMASDLWMERPLVTRDSPNMVLTVDASEWGWGAYLSSPDRMEEPLVPVEQGRWTSNPMPTFTQAVMASMKKDYNIKTMEEHSAGVLDALCRRTRMEQPTMPAHNNVLEALAVLYGVVALSPFLSRETRLMIRSDNTTTVAALVKERCANKHVAAAATMARLAIASTGAQLVMVTHIQGQLNTVADQASRSWLDRHKHLEWPMSKEMADRLFQMAGPHWSNKAVDAFASAHNTKLDQFWTLTPHPRATATDAFAQRWKGKQLYINPPFHLMHQVINKLKHDRPARAIVIAPVWPNQPWWSWLHRHAWKEVLVPKEELGGPTVQELGVQRLNRWEVHAYFI